MSSAGLVTLVLVGGPIKVTEELPLKLLCYRQRTRLLPIFRKNAMNVRTNKRRIYDVFYRRFHGPCLWRRSAEEQAWLDVAPVGQEFGSPDYERLQILDLYAAGEMNREDAMRMLGLGSLQALQQQLLAAGLNVPDR